MKTIKNIASILLMLTVIVLFNSCGKDSEIYGKWQVVSLMATDGEHTEAFPFDTSKELTVEFKKDNHYVVAMDGQTSTGEYILQGNDMVFKNLYSETIYDPQSTSEHHYDVSGIIRTLTKTDLSIEFYLDEEVLAEMEEETDLHVIVDFERL